MNNATTACMLFFVFLASIFVTSANAGAEDLQWSGASQVAPDPVQPGLDAFFPGTSVSGNTVTVNDGPTVAGGVYGGVTADSRLVTNNTVLIGPGADIDEGVAGGCGTWNCVE